MSLDRGCVNLNVISPFIEMNMAVHFGGVCGEPSIVFVVFRIVWNVELSYLDLRVTQATMCNASIAKPCDQ